MSIELKFEVFDNYLKVYICGENLFDEISSVIEALRRKLADCNRTKMLIDTHDAKPPSEMEKFYMAEMGAEIFGSNVKTAVITHPQYINKFFENVAVNRGGDVIVTDNEKDALGWLLK